jgi:hypothetical protein
MSDTGSVPRRPRAGWLAVVRDAMTGPLVDNLSDAERQLLEDVLRSEDPVNALRAAILLVATEPIPGPKVAERLGVPQRKVLRCVRRFRRWGIPGVLR